MTIFRSPVFLACLAIFLPALLLAQDSKIESLPGTKPLEWPEEDLSERLMDGAHTFVERQIAESKKKRAQFWNYDFSSPEAYEKSIAPNRERFRKMIGVVDERVSPVTMEKFGEEDVPGLLADLGTYRIWRVRWPVLEGVQGEGLLFEPIPEKMDSKGPCAIIIPDTEDVPELIVSEHRIVGALRFVEKGGRVVIPVLTSRRAYEGRNGEDARLKRSDQTHREWIYRQSFHMGRHVIGYEVQRILGLVDWFSERYPEAPVTVMGRREGALLAFYAAAADPRIDITTIRGYFGQRDGLWSEPIDRNLFGLLREFGDAEIASLIYPRWFTVLTGPNSEFESAKGNIPEFDPDAARAEFERMPKGIRSKMVFRTEVEVPDTGSLRLRAFDDLLEYKETGRHDRLFRQLENHVQSLIPKADDIREESFLFQAEPKLRPGKWSTSKEHPTLDPANFIENAKAFRKKFEEEAMGEFDEPLAPPKPRTRKILETGKWTAWDVVLDVYPPEFFAWGTLLLPKDLKPGEKRPVVVCQHGRNGVPRDCIDAGSSAYNDFAAKLAERGFITFAPHNLYRGEDRYRWLDRKANSIGCTLFSFTIPSHRQILDWLKTQPNVDPDRIAFYGLSYGGETAMRVPPVIEDYAAVICSGDFNQWTRKVAATDFPGSFMKTIEWEMPYWNLGNAFDYAEMAYLIFPRPFMVERGHHDRVSRDHWVAHEYAKVRWLYAQFGMADRTEIEYFQGGHSINGKGTFEFLHKHLNWPRPSGVE